MTGKEIYRKWAPVGVKWTNWVRPVPFIWIDENYNVKEFCNLKKNNITYLKKVLDKTAIIVDLNGLESINEGIGLAECGYRPIPIYNGTNGQKDARVTTNNYIIGMGLIWGANELDKINLDENALPAFLLDTNRLNRLKMDDSIFDNSWDIYNQDIPSPEYFLNNGVEKILVRGDKIQRDLEKILYEFQKKGIKILFTDGFEEIKEVQIKKPKNRKND